MPDESKVMSPEEYDLYFVENLRGFIDWYGGESRDFEIKTRLYQLLAMSFTAAATIIAAIPHSLFGVLLSNDAAKIAETYARFAVVVVSASSAFCISRLTRHGIDEEYRMRESGRAEVNNIAQKARLRLTQIPMTIQERVGYQEQIADDLKKIEMKYGGPVKTAT